MAKQLSKKSVILGLAGLTVAGLTDFAAVTIIKKNEQAEVDKYLGEYQEEAYSIGQQEEDYQKSK
ncbi:hypothetical protein [Microcoleus sp. D3_18a_C4]|uniref:hypothetical protein n=1 Tax=unclassified Microcoleus TaxID=2642155 RepID=UPI002FD42EDF